MIGNDIVDLHTASKESNRHRKGWMEKLFSDNEQQLISHSENKDTMVWLLWTMKEAAYKIINRKSKVMSFAPTKLKCSVRLSAYGAAEGRVQFEDSAYNTFSIISKDYIHTIAVVQNNLEGINVYIRDEENTQLPEYPGYIFLKDEYGIPYLKGADGRLKDISKSHHGRYEAVVY